jgi:tetrahydromethanopterin S-methyltransferase subunit E
MVAATVHSDRFNICTCCITVYSSLSTDLLHHILTQPIWAVILGIGIRVAHQSCHGRVL